MRRATVCTLWLAVFAGSAAWAQNPVPVTHWEFQAVSADGTGAFGGANPPERVLLEGIILNSPEAMLDPSPDGGALSMGGQWQIFIQGEGADHAGTAVWIGQNYGNMPWLTHPDDSYSDGEWLEELCRINHDPNTGWLFQPGDRVRVTGKYLFYNGKNNINEQHDKSPVSDFVVELLEPAAGLPQPEVVALGDLKDQNNQFIFDPARLTGCEYYQACRIRINQVSFVNPAAWAPDAMMEITDGGGRTFPVKLGIGPGIAAGTNNLNPVFDVIGILNQEGGYPHVGGYQIWVTDYDGNGRVLTDRTPRRGNLAADLNYDGIVDMVDFAVLANQWLHTATGIYGCLK